MGMSTGNNKGGIQSDINVTPLIDVLLVLLIIFLLVMPIMMKKEQLEVPRKINDNEQVADNTVQLTIRVSPGVPNPVLTFDDGTKPEGQPGDPISLDEIKPKLGEKLNAMRAGQDKVVFVDFDAKVPWHDVVKTMDQIRSIATDENHDEVKVALKVKDDKDPAAAATP